MFGARSGRAHAHQTTTELTHRGLTRSHTKQRPKGDPGPGGRSPISRRISTVITPWAPSRIPQDRTGPSARLEKQLCNAAFASRSFWQLPQSASLAWRSCQRRGGAVSFAPQARFGGGGASPQSVAVADFNRDSNPALAVANFFSDKVSVLLGNGSGGMAAATGFAVGSNSRSVAVGDFNGDGSPDLATANTGRIMCRYY